MDDVLNVDILKEFNKFGRVWGTRPGEFESPFMVTPKEFIQYAEANLNENTPHGLLDCLSNTKRAIECQMDSLLMFLGLYDIAKKKNLGFPSKAEMLNKAGIISPRILIKINKTRNLMEHSYEIPEKEKVEDSLDAAYLFVLSTEKYLSISTYAFDIENDLQEDEIENEKPLYDGSYSIKLDPELRTLFIKSNIFLFSETYEGRQEIEKEIVFDSDEYYDYLKIYVQLYDLVGIR
ncbi:hypothetical protein [Methanolobus sp. WCC4]|uniref:hypothetical protein n=1 Tax=Methanolobus sp. WCC4 TaxID=3125784 RepID=UPI0030F7047F